MDRKKANIVVPVNPLATATSGLTPDAGNLMPPAIHGMAMENSEPTMFRSGMSWRQAQKMLQTAEVQNSRFDMGQFEKYYGQESINWCALISESGECMSVAAVQNDHPFAGYAYIDEIQTLKKGYGLPLLKKIVEEFKKVWLMANTAAGDSLVDYYRDTGMFEEIYIEDSVYECPAYFFCTRECDYDRLEGYCNAFYANDDGDADADGQQDFNESSIKTVKKESSIDFPASSGLCEDIWDAVGDSWTIKSEIKEKALGLVNLLLEKYKVRARGVNVVGSICSNQYTDDADIDVHIILGLPSESVNALNSIRKLEQERLFSGMDLMAGGTTHPLEFYFQSNIYSDMGSCGCYDLINDKWLTKPQLVDLEFDPFEEYESSWNEAFEFGLRVQTALFELRKNLYRHGAILQQAQSRDIYSDSGLMGMVERRLDKVKGDIVQNMAEISELKAEMVQTRRRAGLNPQSAEDAEKMRTDREWLTANSTFKLLQRLDVMDSCWLISELYKDASDIDYVIGQLHQFMD